MAITLALHGIGKLCRQTRVGKKAIKAGDFVRLSDIADIQQLKFGDIEIQQTDNIIFGFKKGWKFGLFFDFGNYSKENPLDATALYQGLGSYYKYLTFQEEYSVLENETLFNQMVNDGWLMTDGFPLSNCWAEALKDSPKYMRTGMERTNRASTNPSMSSSIFTINQGYIHLLIIGGVTTYSMRKKQF